MKAAEAISGEIQLDKLLVKLMQIVIENAGAQHGYFIQQQGRQWVIQAEGVIATENIADAETQPQAEVTALQARAVTSQKLSQAIVNYVARTHESVVLNDAAHEGPFTQDQYIVDQQPKSILCAPLINQGRLTGIIYLEK